jgi:hypothetical protein
MDPEGMDPEFDGEGDLDSPENISDPAHLRGQQADHSNPAASQDKASQRRSHFADDPVEDENDAEEDEEDAEPRSPQHNRRESDRNRPAEPGDRRR